LLKLFLSYSFFRYFDTVQEKDAWLRQMKADFMRRKLDVEPLNLIKKLYANSSNQVCRQEGVYQQPMSALRSNSVLENSPFVPQANLPPNEVSLKRSAPESFMSTNNLVFGKDEQHLFDNIVDFDPSSHTSKNKKVSGLCLSGASAKMMWLCESCGEYCSDPSEHVHQSNKKLKASLMGPFEGTVLSDEIHASETDSSDEEVAEKDDLLDGLMHYMMNQSYPDIGEYDDLSFCV
jgi:hypothetical protein